MSKESLSANYLGVFFFSWTDSNMSIQIYFLGKTRVPNLTLEWLLSFMNWFSMRNHYSDDVFEKKLCHNDLHSFLPSRTNSIWLFRTYLYVRNFDLIRYLFWQKLHHRHCIYIGVVSFINIQYVHSYFHF